MKKLILGTAVAFVLSCASTPKITQNSSFGNAGLKLPPLAEKQLANGLKILYIRDASLPKISITGLVKVGATQDEAHKRGLNYLTGSLLDEGSGKHNSSEIAERMEYLGGALTVNPGSDFTTISVNGLSFTKVELMDAFLEVLLTPKFPDSEIIRVKKMIGSQIKRQKDEPESYTNAMFSKILFGEHPYGYANYGTIKSLNSISRKDILKHYSQYYKPNNSYIAVVGDFDEAFEKQLEAKLLTWMQDNIPVYQKVKTNQSTATQIYFQGKKSLVQTQIRLGHIFVERNHSDYMKLRLANMVLGGAFASRLNQVVRDDLGLTYGAHSFFDAKKEPGYFAISTFTRNEKVLDTIQATQKVFKDFHDEGIKLEELNAAKSVMAGQFPRAVETMEDLAFNMLNLRFYGIDDAYLTQFISTLNSYSLEQVNEVIRQHFQPENLQIVVFGEDKVADQLKKISKVKIVPANWQD